MKKVEFFFDCSSPWTYLAFHRFQSIIKEVNVDIYWKPILVGGVFNKVNQDVYNNRLNPNPLKFKYSRKDLQDWANYYKISINWPKIFPLNAVNVMRAVIVSETFDKLIPFSLLCFENYWSKGIDISDLNILSELAESIDIDKEIFQEEIKKQNTKDLLRSNTDELINRGGFGSPTIFINGDDMYFGNDRMELVRKKIIEETNENE
ncbi:MAG: 2-hydroxychromene-2-carboxylate isomerase [Alphaproteobacteria bacterium]|jgi:2-hydroxychromene-2-carboxylate isomerase|nr:2-hydroxychromene-2-carboxylate isomerase [Rhodobiaceae bacterium]MDC0070788.1 2-hydroxychromene-2-carboxylate isomerase [Rhodobiaceae bacterium]PDH51790.1 MAG: 2-hydroxychromene-2-carboxylate isomerase [alpha proteobacterium MED-G09]|tara:strand:+ start:24630 stop:25247 length:618 start_codon:yes stop_codon:yes gene_type:complete